MTMSCVAEAVATTTAASATIHGATSGFWKPRKTIAAMSRSWDSTSQPRRWPSARPKHRHLEGIDDGRPQEFDGVGDADQREETDGAEIDADILHPQEQRRAGERERQPGGEAEQENDEHAPVEEDAPGAREALAEALPSRSLRCHHAAT